MRILVLTSFLPWPLASGGQVREHRLLGAARAAHQLTLVVEEAGAGSPADRRALQEMWPEVEIHPRPDEPAAELPPQRELPGWRMAVRRARARYDPARSIIRHPLHPSTMSTITDLSRQPFDLLQVEFTQTYRYLPSRPRPPVLLDAQDVLFRRARTAARMHPDANVELGDRRAARHERAVLRDADIVVVTSEPEYQAATAAGARDVRIVPNGADDDLLALPADGTCERILFVGWGGHHPNRDAVAWWRDEVAPHMPEGTCLEVAGAGWEGFPGGPGTRFLGYVEDTRHLLKGSLVVVPLRAGGGTKLKVLEAMAAGRPIVSTSWGAEGIPVTPGRELFVEDSPAAFAASVERLRADAALGARLGVAAREAVRPFLWSAAGGRMLELYESLR